MTAAVAVELRRVRLPLLHPHVAAHGREDAREVVLVRCVLDDGTEGWGECSTLATPSAYAPEHTAGAWAALTGGLAAQFLTGEPLPPGHPMAASALVAARLDAELRRRHHNLAAELGANRVEVASTTVVGLQRDVDALVARAEETATGLKVKIAPGHDVEPLRALRALWPDRWLAVDANGAYTPDTFPDLDGFHLAYVEQPVADLVGCAAVASAIGTPVCLDEAVADPGALDAALALGAGSVLNVKPGRCGGPREAVAWATRAAESGMHVFVGGMLETGVGRATALAVAAAPVCTLPTDLGPTRHYFSHRDEITEPLVTGGAGGVVVPSGPGIGVTPRPDRLEAATLQAAWCRV